MASSMDDESKLLTDDQLQAIKNFEEVVSYPHDQGFHVAYKDEEKVRLVNDCLRYREWLRRLTTECYAKSADGCVEYVRCAETANLIEEVRAALKSDKRDQS